MYICDPGHPVSGAGSAPVAGPDPSPRSASLPFGLGSLNPGPSMCPSQAPGDLHPPGVPVKGAAALGRRSPTGPRAFSVPGGEAFLGSPRRGSLRSAALGRRARPSGLSATDVDEGVLSDSASSSHLRAGERSSHTAQTPCKRFWRTFATSPHSRRGPSWKGAQNGLERLRGIPASTAEPSFRKGPRRPASKCDDTHTRNARVDLHQPFGWGSIESSTPRERNSPDRPPQSSGGLTDRPEELTRGDEIPSQLGGSAST